MEEHSDGEKRPIRSKRPKEEEEKRVRDNGSTTRSRCAADLPGPKAALAFPLLMLLTLLSVTDAIPPPIGNGSAAVHRDREGPDSIGKQFGLRKTLEFWHIIPSLCKKLKKNG